MHLGAVTYNPASSAFEALALDRAGDCEVRIACHFAAPINTPLTEAIKGLLSDANRQFRGRPRLAARRRCVNRSLSFPDYAGRFSTE